MKKKSLIIALIVVFYDQLIKYVIDGSFYYGQLKAIIPKFFYLTKVYNDGAAWSVLRGSVTVLIIVAILALVFLYRYEKSFKKNKKNILAFGLVYGGLVGNLIDRIRLGHVIDYFKIDLGHYEFPIFNLADIAIVVGFILIIYAIYKGEDKNGIKSRKK